MSLTAVARACLNLAGSWQLAFDPDNIGLRDGWFNGHWPEALWHAEQVPSSWNVAHPDAEGIGFYRKQFRLPDNWAGRVVRLHFTGVSYAATVWLNGRCAGSHEGAYDPFVFDVSDLCRFGTDNELIVRVACLSQKAAVDGLLLQQVPASKQSWYYTYGGLWGDVVLEAAALIWCQSLVVEPDLRAEMALVTVGVQNSHPTSQLVDLELQITDPEGGSAYAARMALSAPAGLARFAYGVHLPRPAAWTCETPQLYQLRVDLHSDEVDSASTYFGMRDFSVRDGQFFLNGEPIYLRGVLLQPNFPVQLVAPPDPAMMEQEIRLAKDAGFNMIRVHIRPAPPGYLDLTDRLGMLVYAESSLAWIKDSPRLREHGRREVLTLIERDRNHPSVVIWGIYNENRQANAINGEALMQWARTLDPTRVIVDNSGGSFVIDQDFSWIDRAHVLAERESCPQLIQDVHIYVGAPIASEVYDWMRTLGLPDTGHNIPGHDFGSAAIMEEWNRELRAYRGKILVSELGVGGMAVLDKIVAGYGDRVDLKDARDMLAYRNSLHQGFAQRRLERLFGSVEGLIQATQALQAAGNTRQFEALLCNPRVSGYVLTQLNDVAGEFHAGLVDHWRQPKQAYYAAREVHQPHRIVLKAERAVAACGESIVVSLTLLARHALPDGAQVQISLLGPAGLQSWSLTMSVPAGAGIKPLGLVTLELGSGSGEYRVDARLTSGSESVTQSSEVIVALPSVDWSQLPARLEGFGRVPEPLQFPSQDTAHGLALAPDPASLTAGDWESLLSAVHAGRAGVIGPLHPRDTMALRTLSAHGIDVRLHYAIGSWMGCYHWMPQSELFEGLPAGGLAGETYVDVLPWYGMTELGGEVYAGSLRNTQLREAPAAMLWYSEIEAIPFGRGRLFFCQYRIFSSCERNPLAARLAYNLLGLAHRSESGED